jgi:lipopolysaccharide export system permease protein
MLFSRLDKYIFTQSLIGLAIALGSICVSIVLVDLVEQLRVISGVKSAGFTTALYFSLIRVPGLVEQTTPITILIAALLTYTGLSRRSEIIAMRAAGISAWRFLAPLGALAILLGLCVIFIIGPASAKLNKLYEFKRDNLLSQLQITNTIDKSVVSFLNISTKNQQLVLIGTPLNNKNSNYKNATILEYQKDGTNFIRRIDSANISISANKIIANECLISNAGVANQRINLIEYEIMPESRNSSTIEASSLPLWELPKAAQKAKISGGSPQKYWLRFYKLLAMPLTMLSMALFAGIMSVGLDRSGGKVKSVFIALAVGLLMYFGNDFAALLASNGKLPVAIAALCPPLFVLGATLAFISSREDGDIVSQSHDIAL